MVFKVSKGGVRSGNTLRGLHSLRLRRYSRQACVVGRSNLPPKEVKDRLESSIEDEFISSTLGSTDVVLSLNKKQRWLLPATVSHMIKTGSFKDENTTVSVLERHKLRRTANCIGFVCNKGKVHHVVSRQNRYFSFNLKNFDADTSKRERKREKAKLMKLIPKTETKVRRDKTNSLIKTTDVYTLQGSINIDEWIKKRNGANIPKTGYSLEVFYPCPQTCSLVYNPKYTDVNMTSNENSNMPIKANIKSTRGKRKQRKRITTKDYEAIAEEVTGYFMKECFEDNHDNKLNNNLLEEINDGSSLECGEDPINTSIKDLRYSLGVFISQAEKAKSNSRNSTQHRRRRSTRFSSHSISDELPDVKSHIIYLDECNPMIKPSASASNASQQGPILCPAPVILPSVETDPGNLQAKYGSLYAEAECLPRRFVVNITNDVQNLLNTSVSSKDNNVFTSFLVFVYDGSHKEGLDNFNVFISSNICMDTVKVIEHISLEQESVDSIMQQATSALLSLQVKNPPTWRYHRSKEHIFIPVLDFIHQLLNVRIETLQTKYELAKLSIILSDKENTNVNEHKIVKNINPSLSCDICYENINEIRSKGGLCAQLLRCDHMFCDACWREHIRTKINNGARRITCPGFNCNTSVGPVTLLSLLHVSEVCQMFQRICQEDAESSPNCRWCPNPDCGRIIRLDIEKVSNNGSLDVTCACGNEFCFSCQSKPHWPATCEQAEEYLDKLGTISLPKDRTDVLEPISDHVQPKTMKKIKPLEIDGKLCPKCRRFVEKYRGCSHVVCNCGFAFCWSCLKPADHSNNCTPNRALMFEYTHKVIINHVVLPDLNNVPGLPSPMTVTKPPKSHHKLSMCQKALMQRLGSQDSMNYKLLKELARKIASVAEKDILLKQELLSKSRVGTAQEDIAILTSTPLTSHVTRFIRSCFQTQQELHRVAEFTFVMLQDTSDSIERRLALRLANDLCGYCSFTKSVLELGQDQDMRTAVHRLMDIQLWSRQALVLLVSCVNKLRS